MHGVRDWLLARDGGLRATRRAARTAIVMPALFALGSVVLGNPGVATFAAFGSFAMLMLADFPGTRIERVAAQAGLIATGCVFIVLATLVSPNPWAAAVAMAVVGFLVLFAGVVSSTLAGASTAALLSFILPVATPAGPGAIPDRLIGWLLAGAVSLPAVTLLWPAPRSEPLRDAAAEVCRRLAARLTAEAGRCGAEDGRVVEEAVTRLDDAVATLRGIFLATPYRPSGLTTAARAVVRLVDQVIWLSIVVDTAPARRARSRAGPTVGAVETAAAVLLDHAGKTLSLREPPQDSLRDHLDALVDARRTMEAATTAQVVLPRDGQPAEDLVRSLAPSGHAEELASAVLSVSQDIAVVTAADERAWWRKLLGREPAGPTGPFASAQERALAHVEPHSVWLRNSLRGAAALGGAVLVADLTAVQHSFWIVLGALSVLRSNALSTGQSVVRGLIGTTIGFALGGGLVLVLGTDPALSWLALPVAVLIAGVAPAVSFTAGQAGFTVALLVLFNIISPAGWQVGLVRIEDIAIGCAVSLVVGVSLWPRGAAGALRQALAEAYAASAAHLRSAVESGAVGRSAAETEESRRRAAAAARRLDDAFREYLAERGTKRLTLAQVAALLTGIAGLRLTAEAVSELWAGVGADRPDTPRARLEVMVSAERVTDWFAALAQAMTGIGAVPPALAEDPAAGCRLADALTRDLATVAAEDATAARAQTVRMVWTSNHLDADRRLQLLIEDPARTASQHPVRPRGEPIVLRRATADLDAAAGGAERAQG